jgi:lambda family phage portal protein
MKILPQSIRAWLHARTGPAAPARGNVRMYQSAKNTRLNASWSAPTTSADTELYTSLGTLRGRSRALVRDAAYAKRAKVVVVNNVIGAGMGMQGNVRTSDGKLLKAVNDGIEYAWCEWSRAENCHTGGAMHFNDLERAAMGQVFEAGECFLRLHRRPFGRSAVPLAIELIEAERIADDYSQPVGANGENQVRMGIEVDTFGRAVAYWVRNQHPSEIRYNISATDVMYRVPAADMIHLRIVDRWPQTRGEPWMHATARRLNDMDGYSEAEIVAARASAAYMAFIIDPNGTTSVGDAPAEDGTRTITMEPGIVETLGPGEDIRFHDPSRPNTAIDPFLRYMLREVAAGVGVSYESLSRDYSQSNYSSSRLALLDDRDLWRTLQQWWIRSLREPLHRIWLEQAALAGAVAGLTLEAYLNRTEKYAAVKFKPRGWNWVDPTKEVEAYKEAVLAGFTTVSDVIAQTGNGRDLEDVLQERRSELDMMEELDLEFDTEYVEPPEAAPATPAPPSATAEGDSTEDPAPPAARLRKVN